MKQIRECADGFAAPANTVGMGDVYIDNASQSASEPLAGVEKAKKNSKKKMLSSLKKYLKNKIKEKQ